MDAYLAIASRREVRRYADRPVPEDVQRRIVDAGRVAGSAANRQPWRFMWVSDRDRLERLAETVYAPDNIRGCAFAVAIAATGKGPTSFDAGRAAQNMLLAAWNEGVGSSPNGMPDRGAAAEVLGLSDEPTIVLSFGYPARGRDPESRSAEEWIEAANRKPFDEVVERV
ncbi:MAG TPA: nitroreductase family protein [Thermoleophilaceae bacterium]|nr:nitroreductase family protein [Thermoleophilaceae bacterium]